MTFESQLRDLIPDALSEDQEKVKVVAETQYKMKIDRALVPTTSPLPAKDIIETMDLIRQVVLDYQAREQTTEDAAIEVIHEYPDRFYELEVISISLKERMPGAFDQGSPWEGKVKNLRPILREEQEDPDNPGYRRAILGYFHDNTLELTCWARTNKQANLRALWLENIMEEYAWFFGLSGVNRLLYQGRTEPITRTFNNNILFGRTIKYFVRTEKLIAISQKKLEEVYLSLAVTQKLYVK